MVDDLQARAGVDAKLATRTALFGLLQSLPTPVISEMAALGGYDFVLLDAQHGGFSPLNILPILYALKSMNCCSIVRLREQNPHILTQFLDFGVDGVVVPNVRTRNEAQAIAGAARCPPHGTRSLGASLHRSTCYGRTVSEYHARLFVLIETNIGAENAHEIMEVDGIDGAVIGPYDLSADLGCLGDFSTSAYMDAFSSIETAALKHGKLVGTALHPGFSAEALIARGHRLLIAGADSPLICRAFELHLCRMRSSS